MKKVQLITAGESHGPGLTATLLGMPAGLTLDFDFIATEMRRRQHGYGRGNRMKIEQDTAEIRGGVRGGETLGSPIVLWIENRDFKNWGPMMDPVQIDPRRAEQRRVHMPRPGHTDLAGGQKYLRHDLRDILERASARETAARVAAGAIAQIFLKELGIEIKSAVRSLGPVGADAPPPTWEQLCTMDDSSPLRAADPTLEPAMIALVDRAKEEGDTLGGSITVIAHNVPVGLGSHVQWNEKLDGRLAQALMGIHAIKGVEIGSAIAAAGGFGSQAHDPIVPGVSPGQESHPTRSSNRAGGLEGGVTNGMDVVLTAFKKPIATLRKGMPSMDLDTLEPHQSQYERSDVTALPAAGVIAEAMVALVLTDALLEKSGGDSMAEVKGHWEETLRLQRQWLPLQSPFS